MAVGDTGCGKSTILTALIYGVDDLVEKKENGKMVITSKTDRKEFKIGHSASSSETFFPHFYEDSESSLVYTDIAGGNDTNGDLIAIINALITKSIFKYSSKVKFLVPITKNGVTEGRGKNVREQFRVVQSICYGVPLDEMLKSVKPIVTKCNQKDYELDIDVIRSNLEECL